MTRARQEQTTTVTKIAAADQRPPNDSAVHETSVDQTPTNASVTTRHVLSLPKKTLQMATPPVSLAGQVAQTQSSELEMKRNQMIEPLVSDDDGPTMDIATLLE